MLTLSKLSRYLYEIKTDIHKFVEDEFDDYIDKNVKYRINQIRVGFNINYSYHNKIFSNKKFKYKNVYNVQVSYVLFSDKTLRIYIQKCGKNISKTDPLLEINCSRYTFMILFHNLKYISLLSCFQV
jgi:hypothetical protein